MSQHTQEQTNDHIKHLQSHGNYHLPECTMLPSLISLFPVHNFTGSEITLHAQGHTDANLLSSFKFCLPEFKNVIFPLHHTACLKENDTVVITEHSLDVEDTNYQMYFPCLPANSPQPTSISRAGWVGVGSDPRSLACHKTGEPLTPAPFLR